MTPDDFRRMALALRDVVESAHMGHPDFRVNGRIFATLHGDERFGMVNLTPEQQADFMRAHPGIFTPESGAWGRAGNTRVHLGVADAEAVGEALTLAKQNAVRKGSPKKSKRRPSARPKKR